MNTYCMFTSFFFAEVTKENGIDFGDKIPTGYEVPKTTNSILGEITKKVF